MCAIKRFDVIIMSSSSSSVRSRKALDISQKITSAIGEFSCERF